MTSRKQIWNAACAAVFLAVVTATGPALSQDASTGQESTVKIRIDVGGTAVTATLEDNAAARDFAALLPLAVTLEDYASTEKVADLPGGLDTRDAPEGIDPAVGDITYYAPWGNLAIFYRDFGYARGLVKLGTIESGLEALDKPGSIRATIERIEE